MPNDQIDADVYVGSAGNVVEDWRTVLNSDEDPDDEELAHTPDDVIAALGFDPLDFDTENDGIQTVTKGGAGSGNFGHAGRPGEVGGSSADVTISHDVAISAKPVVASASSKVGVPASSVPTKVPRIANLPKELAAAQERFATKYESNPQGAYDEYYKAAMTHPTEPAVFNADNAKAMSEDYRNTGSLESRAQYNVAVHATADAIAKGAFLKRLDEIAKMPVDQRNILVTSGGVGAGKSSGLPFIPKSVGFNAVWDSTGELNSTENEWVQKEAEKRGIDVTHLFVHADPLTVWPRVIERGIKTGRMVDATLFAESYNDGAHNFASFNEAQINNPRAHFYFVDNSGKPEDRKALSAFPSQALKVRKEELRAYAQQKLRESNAPDWVKKYGDIGKDIWKD